MMDRQLVETINLYLRANVPMDCAISKAEADTSKSLSPDTESKIKEVCGK